MTIKRYAYIAALTAAFSGLPAAFTPINFGNVNPTRFDDPD